MHLIVVTDLAFLLTDTKWPVQRNGVHGRQVGEAHRQWGMGLSFCKCMKNSFTKFFFHLFPLITSVQTPNMGQLLCMHLKKHSFPSTEGKSHGALRGWSQGIWYRCKTLYWFPGLWINCFTRLNRFMQICMPQSLCMIVIEILYNSCLLMRPQDCSLCLGRAVGVGCVCGEKQDGHFILKCVQKSWTAPNFCSMGAYVKNQLAAPGWLLQHRYEPVLVGAAALWLPLTLLAEFALWMHHVQTSSSAEAGFPLCTINTLVPRATSAKAQHRWHYARRKRLLWA